MMSAINALFFIFDSRVITAYLAGGTGEGLRLSQRVADRDLIVVIVGVHLEDHPELAQVAQTGAAPRRLARPPQRREQDANQDRDDPDYHQQFHERETPSLSHCRRSFTRSIP